MSTISRRELGKLVKAAKRFKLRLPGFGAIVEPNYGRNRQTLQVGEIVGMMAPNSEWIDVAEVTNVSMFRDASGERRITVVLVPRLAETSLFEKYTIPMSHVACVLEPYDGQQ